MKFRIEKDSMGECQVPEDAFYAAQTQRAVDNFSVSNRTMPRTFLKALAYVKWAAAKVNTDLGLMPKDISEAIQWAALQIIEQDHSKHFPLDVFQTGSATSTNMNMNEVLAHMASQKSGHAVHPNDHVNMSQSSNDVIPTSIHVSAAIALKETLFPALSHCHTVIQKRAHELENVVKTGRTHLMDAMPVTLGQELGGWAAQIKNGIARLESAKNDIEKLAIGGTAVGTGINAHPEFGAKVAKTLAERLGIAFTRNDNLFESLSSQDAAVGLSGQLKTLAVSFMKISNDLRWMNSGPLAGLGEIALPSLQPGSSIMPGKVNPVIPESMAMICAKVIGNDTTITIAGQSGNFQLNVMLPLVADCLLESIEVMGKGIMRLADKAIAGFTVNQDHLNDALAKNPILVTALNRVIGYELGAKIAKQAYKEKRPLLEVAKENTTLSEAELKRLLDPAHLTQGGIQE